MCIGIPMQVVAVEGTAVLCERPGERRTLDGALLGPLAAGTWVLAHRGAAVRVLSADEAAQTTAALDMLATLLAGGSDIDAGFADLVGREPTLPAHLRGEPE
jgi:hydrogenase expression/formation protein HypC